jgi:hypothetical protein
MTKACLWGILLAMLAGCHKGPPEHAVTPQKMADALYAVMAADRAVYTREVVERLSDKESVVRASEHYKDDRALPLPAQMFRMGAETARKSQSDFTYALLSPWPINRQNAPRTEVEKVGLDRVVKSGERFAAKETLGGNRYFTAIYPDRAISEACVRCHNAHEDSPRHDFKAGDTMGAVVIRIALE